MNLDPNECWPWKGTLHHTGYGLLSVNAGNRTITFQAHRLIYSTLIGPIPDGMIVRHSCDNPPCVNPNHLVLGTHADNAADRSERTSDYRGQRNPNAKLTDEQRAEIIRRYDAGGVTQRQIAAEYGIQQSQVSYILRRQREVDR